MEIRCSDTLSEFQCFGFSSLHYDDLIELYHNKQKTNLILTLFQIVRRSGEKVLIMHKPSNKPDFFQVVAIVVWDAVDDNKSNLLFALLKDILPNYGKSTEVGKLLPNGMCYVLVLRNEVELSQITAKCNFLYIPMPRKEKIVGRLNMCKWPIHRNLTQHTTTPRSVLPSSNFSSVTLRPGGGGGTNYSIKFLNSFLYTQRAFSTLTV
jgi:hypothetical protein